jgi:DNA-binding NarL/FixJ family response regulator
MFSTIYLLLSTREYQVFTHLEKGCSNKEIGKEMHISESTVKFHCRNIYRKLDIKSRIDLLSLLVKHPRCAGEL